MSTRILIVRTPERRSWPIAAALQRRSAAAHRAAADPTRRCPLLSKRRSKRCAWSRSRPKSKVRSTALLRVAHPHEQLQIVAKFLIRELPAGVSDVGNGLLKTNAASADRDSENRKDNAAPLMSEQPRQNRRMHCHRRHPLGVVSPRDIRQNSNNAPAGGAFLSL